MSWRGFYALEVAEPLAKELKLHLKRFAKIPGVNWVNERNLHLTLLFMAEAPFEKMQEMKQLCLDLSEEFEPVTLKCQGIELFPARDPRLVWVKLEDESGGIQQLHKTLQKRCKHMDLDFDKKPLKMHITLGRIKKQIPVHLEREIMQTELDGEALIYDTITLYRSQLSPQGPKYTILEQSKLQ
ncbi:MAG: RNA 2',3'-cyclic phosphodiesterase [Candidatus Cloacimonadaceae bacterium]|jgi:2'-5' RNA ligase